MVYKLVSSKSIAAKVVADSDLETYEYRPSDIIEWIGEAVEKIGAINQYATNVTGENCEDTLPIVGYQVALPCNIHNLISIAYSSNTRGPWLPVRLSTSPFNKWSENASNRPTDCIPGHRHMYSDRELARLLMDMHMGFVNPHDAISAVNANPNLRKVLTELIVRGEPYNRNTLVTKGPNYSADLQYSIKPGFININQPRGFLKLSYTAIPTDEEGYPLVPDLASVSEAIYWYVNMKMLYSKWMRGLVRDAVYQEAKGNWHAYRRGAYGDLMMPNQDGLTTLSNVWNKIYPEMRNDLSFYSTTGERQVINDTNRRYYYGFGFGR